MPALNTPLWLCLHLPELQIDALGPWPRDVHLPALVWEAQTDGGGGGGGGGRRVCAANGAAQALGVQHGQRLASAQALAPQALALARDTGRETAHLHSLALALGSLTPRLVIEPPDVLLELHASLRLFGGVRPLMRRAHALAGTQGRVRLGLAATPLAARLLARRRRARCVRLASTRHQLQAVTLAELARVTPLPAAAGALLHSLGARSLADLARLPRAGLQRRGAGPWLDALDRALGQAPDPQRWFQPAETFTLRRELAWRAEDSASLEAAAAPLLAALCGWLALRWRAAQCWQLRLHHEHGARRSLPDEVLRIDLARPTRDLSHLQRLLREHLQRLPLAAAVDALTLTLEADQPDAGHALPLLVEEGEAAGLDTALLIDRLRARLGSGRVLQLRPHADARPEKADRTEAAQPKPPRPNTPPHASSALAPSHLPRPAWLLRQALPLAVRHDQPLHEGQALRLLGPPERIEHGWHDGLLVRRDYHAALGPDGALLWVYRQRGGSVDEPARWFLHGLFA